MPGGQPETLRQALIAAGVPESSVLSDGEHRIPLHRVLVSSCLGARRDRLAGKSVLVAVDTQLEAALTLLDLDGLARRIVLLPPDVKDVHLASIIRDAAVDAVVCSNPAGFAGHGVGAIHACSIDLRSTGPEVSTVHRTEWLMLTSGTTGEPKIAIHTLKGLSGAIAPHDRGAPRPVWGTFYDIRRYGGLQIFLRSVLCGGSLILSRPGEAVADHLSRLGTEGATHVSGTPSHWRRVLMSSKIVGFAPTYVRLSGEIADQAVLDALSIAFPKASIGHAYASTEAGVGFDVNDGCEGFPASYLDQPRNGAEMRLVDGSLQIRSGRAASGYAGRPDLQLTNAEGWVDTGDTVEIRNSRCHFTGRRGGIINVGGLKVHPEEIEAVINRHGAVRQSRVKARKSPIIGAVVVADVVLREGAGNVDDARHDILALCRSSLPAHKIPALVNVVADIEITASGKVSRQHA